MELFAERRAVFHDHHAQCLLCGLRAGRMNVRHWPLHSLRLPFIRLHCVRRYRQRGFAPEAGKPAFRTLGQIVMQSVSGREIRCHGGVSVRVLVNGCAAIRFIWMKMWVAKVGWINDLILQVSTVSAPFVVHLEDGMNHAFHGASTRHIKKHGAWLQQQLHLFPSFTIRRKQDVLKYHVFELQPWIAKPTRKSLADFRLIISGICRNSHVTTEKPLTFASVRWVEWENALRRWLGLTRPIIS